MMPTTLAPASALPRYMRRRHLRAYLGVSDKELAKLIEARVFAPRRLEGTGRSYFVRDEILAAEAAGKLFKPALL